MKIGEEADGMGIGIPFVNAFHPLLAEIDIPFAIRT
jgi:hypothetical protein